MARDNPFGMGSTVPHDVCSDCTGEAPEPLPLEGVRFTEVSVITFTTKDIRRVAEVAGVTEERARQYLEDENDQHSGLFVAFHYVTGCYPIGKFPP